MIGCAYLHLGESIGHSHDKALEKTSPRMKKKEKKNYIM